VQRHQLVQAVARSRCWLGRLEQQQSHCQEQWHPQQVHCEPQPAATCTDPCTPLLLLIIILLWLQESCSCLPEGRLRPRPTYLSCF
jgi:hypothetical protein